MCYGQAKVGEKSGGGRCGRKYLMLRDHGKIVFPI